MQRPALGVRNNQDENRPANLHLEGAATLFMLLRLPALLDSAPAAGIAESTT